MTAKILETDAEILVPGSLVHFYVSMAVQSSSLAFSPPIYTAHGSELELTQSILDAYEYPAKDSWLTRLGTPDRNGVVLADRGPWPADKLTTTPGTPEHRAARDEAVAAVWEEYGPGYSDAKVKALKDIEKVYGEQIDSWSAVNESWKQATGVTY